MIHMNNDKQRSRRNFIRQSSLGLGAGMVSISVPFRGEEKTIKSKKLPREVCVASIDLKGLRPDATSGSRIKRVLERMSELTGMNPDIICLPELFDRIWVKERKPIGEIAEDEKMPGPVTSSIAAFAKKNNCYVVCPLITKKNGNFYNSSLLIDRKGNIAGVYNKTHPEKKEMLPDQAFAGGHITPGATDQPVIQTDFGKIGMQICYDVNWTDGWDSLKEKGADIILFSSVIPGGRMLNYYALRNNYYIVSSTDGDARVIDISGNDLDCTSDFVRYAWATINLDKVNVSTWPTNGQLPDLFKKYGDRLGIKVWGNTDVITIENRDAQVKVSDVLKEFEIPDYAAYLKHETLIQEKYRPEVSKK